MTVHTGDISVLSFIKDIDRSTHRLQMSTSDAVLYVWPLEEWSNAVLVEVEDQYGQPLLSDTADRQMLVFKNCIESLGVVVRTRPRKQQEE